MLEKVRSLKCAQLSWLAYALLWGCSGTDTRPTPEPELGQAREALNLAAATAICSADPRVQLGVVTQDVCVGAELFFRDEFGGNGRSCASCHPADNNYTIDPSFISQLPNSDPLFVAEQVPALAQLERPDLMRNFGLILENVDGAETPSTKFTMRSVPHCLALSKSITPPAGTVTAPLERTGWSGDGAPNDGRLRDFQSGAIFQHYTQSLARVSGVDFKPATDAELTAIDAFLKTIGRTNELSLASVSLTDAGAQTGRGLFIDTNNRCNGCHSNAGANLGSGVNQNFDTGVEKLRIALLDTQNIPLDGGFGGQGEPAFNHDANGDTIPDSFGNGQFNTPPLIEAADTGPFFHTNAFNTIEQAVDFYNTTAFRDSPAGLAGPVIDLDATEVANIGRFLRVLNAALNAQMAIARIDAVLPVIIEDNNHSTDLQQELLRLALVEADDALEVLSGVSGLNTGAQASLASAHAFLQTASTHASHTQRRNNAEDARAQLVSANASLGSGMSFNMGGGTFMF
jgi:cytochrome c peroxidase